MPKQWEREAQRKKYEDHLRRMETMKPFIDDRAPKRMLLDSKKLNERVIVFIAVLCEILLNGSDFQERYLARVEKGNRLLLDRLGQAMQAHNLDNHRDAPIVFASVQVSVCICAGNPIVVFLIHKCN